MIKLLRTDRKLSKNKYVCLFLVQAKNLYSETEDVRPTISSSLLDRGKELNYQSFTSCQMRT